MDPHDKKNDLTQEKNRWGEHRKDNFGYASNEERLEKRGMEDWELVEKIPESQGKVPVWFMAVVVCVLMVGVGLSFPFWGLRPGVTVNWVDWVTDPGFLGSLVYVTAGAFFVYFMVTRSGGANKNVADSEKNLPSPTNQIEKEIGKQ
jgi:hypothetical protein